MNRCNKGDTALVVEGPSAGTLVICIEKVHAPPACNARSLQPPLWKVDRRLRWTLPEGGSFVQAVAPDCALVPINDIDLNLRPSSYFRPQRLEQYLLSQVKGGVLKRKLQTLFKEGRHSEAQALVDSKGISENDRKALEALHPMFMGGNYLPDTEHREVEIARIQIKSTTYDIASVFAKFDKGVIRYRVVDEYDGATFAGKTKTRSEKPLTLGELADLFLTAWPLMDVLEMNFGVDLRASLEFFLAESDFYPDFDRLCRLRVSQHFTDRSNDMKRDTPKSTGQPSKPSDEELVEKLTNYMEKKATELQAKRKHLRDTFSPVFSNDPPSDSNK